MPDTIINIDALEQNLLIKPLLQGAPPNTETRSLGSLSRLGMDRMSEEAKDDNRRMGQEGMSRDRFHTLFGRDASEPGEARSIRFIPSESRPGHHDNLAGFLRVKEDLGMA